MVHLWEPNYRWAAKCPICKQIAKRMAHYRGTYHIWGEIFTSRVHVAAHPNCQVGLDTLSRRLTAGVPIEQAVLTSFKSIICWGEIFPHITALCRDPRCMVTVETLRRRLHRGQSPEQACSKWPVGLEEF
jgi:hypothetical protein